MRILRAPRLRAMRPALLAVLALALTGCFQMSSVLTVRPDGSATLTEEMTLSGMGLMALAAEAEGGDPWADLDFEGRAAAMGEGVRLASFEPSEDGYRAVYEIDDVDGFGYVTDDELGGDEIGGHLDYQIRFEPAADGGPATLRLFLPKPEAEKPGPAEAEMEAEDAPDEEATAQAIGMMRMFLGEARVTVAVDVEGTVTETTAAHVDGSRVTLLDFPFSALIDALEDDPTLFDGGQPPTAELLARIDGIEGLRMQGPGSVRVRFR